MKNEATIRKWYAAWDAKDWSQLNTLLADEFTFSSPVDDHIGKAAFKTKCWDTQNGLIERFDLLSVSGTERDAFALYVGHTKKGNTFRNVEYFRLAGDCVEALECYFGGQDTFASAVDITRK